MQLNSPSFKHMFLLPSWNIISCPPPYFSAVTSQSLWITTLFCWTLNVEITQVLSSVLFSIFVLNIIHSNGLVSTISVYSPDLSLRFNRHLSINKPRKEFLFQLPPHLLCLSVLLCSAVITQLLKSVFQGSSLIPPSPVSFQSITRSSILVNAIKWHSLITPSFSLTPHMLPLTHHQLTL